MVHKTGSTPLAGTSFSSHYSLTTCYTVDIQWMNSHSPSRHIMPIQYNTSKPRELTNTHRREKLNSSAIIKKYPIVNQTAERKHPTGCYWLKSHQAHWCPTEKLEAIQPMLCYATGGVNISLLERRLQNKAAIHLYPLVVNFRPFERPSLFTYCNWPEVTNLHLTLLACYHISHSTSPQALLLFT